MQSTTIYSVTQLNGLARQLLETNFNQIWLTGEISNFTQPVSGHWYLTLKDENAQVRCAMFRMKNSRVTFHPQNGVQVLVRASVSLYEPRGDYQLIIEAMHPAGEGLLQQKFDALKMKLAAEGLFAQHLKKRLPDFPKRIGIITSATGAALQDILNILARRDPSLGIVIYPTPVQGTEATAELVQMIELANLRREVDVLIVGRGGGSLEDLWCFNEEAVARAIFNSALPIISAVGHETDVTIADFVADLRAPTPSAAAELVSRDQEELLQQLFYKKQRLEMAIDRLLHNWRQRLQHQITRLHNQHPRNQLHLQANKATQLRHRLELAMQHQLEKTQQNLTALARRLKTNPLPYRLYSLRQKTAQLKVRLNLSIDRELKHRQNQLAGLAGKLDGLSPLKTLARGYSITEDMQGIPLNSIRQVQPNMRIKTRFIDGEIVSCVIKE